MGAAGAPGVRGRRPGWRRETDFEMIRAENPGGGGGDTQDPPRADGMAPADRQTDGQSLDWGQHPNITDAALTQWTRQRSDTH